MTKKDSFATCAERLYVIEQMTINEIASQLKIHEKSVRNWKTEFEWDKKREQYIDSKQMFHQELFNFARKLMVSIEYDMENNQRVDPGRMFAFTKMLPMIGKIKEYEDEISQKTGEETDSKELTPEFIKKIQEEFLGIKYDD